jgi:hypothetical protein
MDGKVDVVSVQGKLWKSLLVAGERALVAGGVAGEVGKMEVVGVVEEVVGVMWYQLITHHLVMLKPPPHLVGAHLEIPLVGVRMTLLRSQGAGAGTREKIGMMTEGEMTVLRTGITRAISEDLLQTQVGGRRLEANRSSFLCFGSVAVCFSSCFCGLKDEE